MEKERLDKKVKEFEAEHPNIDLTPIYENDKTEKARQVLNKKAYASYKAFHFLKSGVKRGKDLLEGTEQGKTVEPLSAAKQRLQDNDPYNFPALDKSIRSVLSPDVDMP